MWAATASVTVVLSAATVTGGLLAHSLVCERTGRNVNLRLAHLKPVRWLLTRAAYNRLAEVVRRKKGERFPAQWDGGTAILLSRDEFVPTRMYGAPRYRYRAHTTIVSARVFSGLFWRIFSAPDSVALRRALGDCSVWRMTVFETDALGFKITDFPYRAGTPTVLFLGDSFTEGLHVRSRDTFVNHYGRALHDLGIDAAPVNAGVNGYGVLEETWTAERFAPTLGARLVILNLYRNDAQSPRGEMRQYLRRLAAFCRRSQIMLVVAVIPDKSELDPSRPVPGFQRRVEAWCAAHRVPFLDARPYLLAHGGQANYFLWDPHLNEAGHVHYASFLVEGTRPLLEQAFESSRRVRSRPSLGFHVK